MSHNNITTGGLNNIYGNLKPDSIYQVSNAAQVTYQPTTEPIYAIATGWRAIEWCETTHEEEPVGISVIPILGLCATQYIVADTPYPRPAHPERIMGVLAPDVVVDVDLWMIRAKEKWGAWRAEQVAAKLAGESKKSDEAPKMTAQMAHALWMQNHHDPLKSPYQSSLAAQHAAQQSGILTRLFGGVW